MLAFTNKLDRREVAHVADLEVSGFGAARERIAPELAAALETAAGRIRAYHEKQRGESWDFREADGTVLGGPSPPAAAPRHGSPNRKNRLATTSVPATVATPTRLQSMVPRGVDGDAGSSSSGRVVALVDAGASGSESAADPPEGTRVPPGVSPGAPVTGVPPSGADGVVPDHEHPLVVPLGEEVAQLDVDVGGVPGIGVSLLA